MKYNIYGRTHLKNDAIIQYVKVKTNKKVESLYKFYLDNFETHCHCSYDCCGHYFSSLMDIKRKGKVITMKIGYAQNY